jgi:hypothetical protein
MWQDAYKLHHLVIRFANVELKSSRLFRLWHTARHEYRREYMSTIDPTTGLAAVCSTAAELYILRERAPAERLQRMIYDHTHPGISRRFIAG